MRDNGAIRWIMPLAVAVVLVCAALLADSDSPWVLPIIWISLPVLWIVLPMIHVLLNPTLTISDAPTCGECGYNLTGNITGRCPECGTRMG